MAALLREYFVWSSRYFFSAHRIPGVIVVIIRHWALWISISGTSLIKIFALIILYQRSYVGFTLRRFVVVDRWLLNKWLDIKCRSNAHPSPLYSLRLRTLFSFFLSLSLYIPSSPPCIAVAGSSRSRSFRKTRGGLPRLYWLWVTFLHLLLTGLLSSLFQLRHKLLAKLILEGMSAQVS